MQVQVKQRAAIYCRISETDERVDKVATQEATCRKFARSQGYDVVQVYADDGISGYKFKDRPDYLQMLTDAEAGGFQVLVATFEDRLSRQPSEKLALAAACAKGGVVWHTVHDGLIDPASEEGELFLYFRGWMGRKEQTHKIKRLRDRFEERRAEGMPLWGVRPFGFELNRIDHRESEAVELQWAYEHVLAGGSLYAIQQAWNSRGLRTTRGNDWSYATVRQLLMRPRNAGLAERDGEVIEEVQAQWEPIVSREDWQTACSILTDPHRSTTTSREPRWLCAGLARCWCGSVMRSGSGSDRKGRFPIYRCADRRDGPPGKRHASIKPDDLDPVVVDAVVSTFVYSPTSGLPSETADLADVRRLQGRLRDVRGQRDALIDSIGLPGITKATIAKRATNLAFDEAVIVTALDDHARQSAHAAMIVESRAALWTAPRKRVSLAAAAALKQQLNERFQALPLTQRRTLVRSLLVITVESWKCGASSDRVHIEHIGAPDLDTDDET